jgi:hypothetical protein
MGRVIGHVEEPWGGRIRRFKFLVCHCGHEMTLYDGWSNECECGTEYNGAGQQLAPRSQWGEETGERF